MIPKQFAKNLNRKQRRDAYKSIKRDLFGKVDDCRYALVGLGVTPGALPAVRSRKVMSGYYSLIKRDLKGATAFQVMLDSLKAESMLW